MKKLGIDTSKQDVVPDFELDENNEFLINDCKVSDIKKEINELLASLNMELNGEDGLAGDKLPQGKKDTQNSKDAFKEMVEHSSNQYLYIDIWEPYGFA
jgi:hypothetical protein